MRIHNNVDHGTHMVPMDSMLDMHHTTTAYGQYMSQQRRPSALVTRQSFPSPTQNFQPC